MFWLTYIPQGILCKIIWCFPHGFKWKYSDFRQRSKSQVSKSTGVHKLKDVHASPYARTEMQIVFFPVFWVVPTKHTPSHCAGEKKDILSMKFIKP